MAAVYRNVYQVHLVQNEGTVKPAQTFNAEVDANRLRIAMKGAGSDQMAIIDTIVNRSNHQRQEIATLFKTKYGKDLVKELKSELSGDLENLILALMVPSADYDATELKKATKGIGTDDDALVEIMCSKNNTEMTRMKQAYTRLYKCEVSKDIEGDTSGAYKNLMVSLSMGGRQEHMSLDFDKARKDAEALFAAGEKRLGTDETEFNAILAFQSYAQLRLVCEEYKKVTKKHTLEEAIKKEMSGNLCKAMLTILKCAHSRIEYFAEKLYLSMKGLGTDDKALIRLLVGRSEVDLVPIKEQFLKMYKKPLETFIEGDCSGNYKKALLMLTKE